jgi:hypothetical protein
MSTTTSSTSKTCFRLTDKRRTEMLGLSKTEVIAYLAACGYDVTRIEYKESKHQIPKKIVVPGPDRWWIKHHIYFDKTTRRVSGVY